MKTQRLGDTVRADYHGTEIEGVITDFDGSGFAYVLLSCPVVIHGLERLAGDKLAFDRYARCSFITLTKGPELTDADIVRHGFEAMGGQSLKVQS